MTVEGVVAIVAFATPGVHLVIRRFQERFRSGWIHMALFFVSCWFGAGYTAGWEAWLTVPVLVAVALVSQYVFMWESRSTRAE